MARVDISQLALNSLAEACLWSIPVSSGYSLNPVIGAIQLGLHYCQRWYRIKRIWFFPARATFDRHFANIELPLAPSMKSACRVDALRLSTLVGHD